MVSDMDCLITKTNAAAMRVHKATNGRQQLLPIDSIYKKNQEWNRYSIQFNLIQFNSINIYLDTALTRYNTSLVLHNIDRFE